MNRRTNDAEALDTADLTTDELISTVQAGQSAAFAEIVRRHQQSVLQIVNAMLYDRAATEDLVQQVFLNAYQHLNSFEPGRDFGFWIRAIARNVVRQELRRASRYDAHLKNYVVTLESHWSDDEQSDERQHELNDSLEECLKRLTDRAVEVVRFRYHDGWECDRIAQELNSSSGAVRNLLCRARAQLRECIEQRLAEN